MRGLLVALVAVIVVSANNWDNNQRAIGVGQQGGRCVSNPYVNNFDYKWKWCDVEVDDDVWDWDYLESHLDDCLKHHSNMTINFKPQTGDYAPTFMYAEYNSKEPSLGYVPMVLLDGHPDTPWPYYLDANYQAYFQRFIRKVYNWLINSKYYNTSIFETQCAFGSTGDDTPWHGTPVNSSYDISGSQWWAFCQNQSAYYYDVYYNSTPSTIPNLLLVYNFQDSRSKYEWIINNCPGTYQKSGTSSHGYQLNEEMDDYNGLGMYARTLTQYVRGYDIKMRIRGEISTTEGGSGGDGWFEEAFYWNFFTCHLWYLTYGLDFPGWKSTVLDYDYPNWGPPNDPSQMDIVMTFFNTFVKSKVARESSGAFISLRDGLDSADTKRFPESIFGTAKISNEDRMKKIAANQSAWGAKLEWASHATGSAMNNRKSPKLNDVGYKIYPYNYGKFMEQVNPQGTSQGYWRVGSMTDPTQMYGRFARGLDHSAGKTKMCFVLDQGLWGGLPLQKKLTLYWNVTYFDQGKGSWGFEYDSLYGAGEVAHTQQKTNTGKWKIANFVIDDAYFGRQGSMESDFCLYSNSKEDDLFSFMQVLDSF